MEVWVQMAQFLFIANGKANSHYFAISSFAILEEWASETEPHFSILFFFSLSEAVQTQRGLRSAIVEIFMSV